MKQVLRNISILALAFMVTACASGAKPQNMAVQPGPGITDKTALKQAVAVGNVSGGSETNPMWMSKVDGPSFKAAFEQSLANMGYKAVGNKKPKYIVDAELKSLDQPLMGFTMDVQSSVLYTVDKGGAKQSYPVTATGSASPSDAFLGVERLRIANERSIQANIKAFLNQVQ